VRWPVSFEWSAEMNRHEEREPASLETYEFVPLEDIPVRPHRLHEPPAPIRNGFSSRRTTPSIKPLVPAAHSSPAQLHYPLASSSRPVQQGRRDEKGSKPVLSYCPSSRSSRPMSTKPLQKGIPIPPTESRQSGWPIETILQPTAAILASAAATLTNDLTQSGLKTSVSLFRSTT